MASATRTASRTTKTAALAGSNAMNASKPNGMVATAKTGHLRSRRLRLSRFASMSRGWSWSFPVFQASPIPFVDPPQKARRSTADVTSLRRRAEAIAQPRSPRKSPAEAGAKSMAPKWRRRGQHQKRCTPEGHRVRRVIATEQPRRFRFSDWALPQRNAPASADRGVKASGSCCARRRRPWPQRAHVTSLMRATPPYGRRPGDPVEAPAKHRSQHDRHRRHHRP
jgi:hypothetical protein